MMKKIKAKQEIKEAAVKKEKTPYMSKGIYNNYAKGMKEKNKQRGKMGLGELYIRTFEEWSTQ